MSLKNSVGVATAAILTALTGMAVPPALAACGAVIDATCVGREIVETARGIEHPMARVRLLSEAARYLPADETTALLTDLLAVAEAVKDPGNRTITLMQLAGVMSDIEMEGGPALARKLAAGIFENGPDDRMMIEVLGREAAATEQIRRIARFQAMHGDVEGAEIAIGYQASEADKVDTMFTVAEALVVRDNGQVGHLRRQAEAAPAGNNEEAGRLLRQAMARLAGIDDPARADRIKLTAVRALARMGWVDEALALAETTAEITPRVEAIGIVVAVLAETGQVDRAREQYARIAGLSASDNALWPLSMAVARAGQMEEARKMLRDIEWPMGRDQANGDLAGIQAGQGDLNGALDIIADLPEGFARNRGLRLVLTALVEAGRWQEAEDYAASLADPGLRTTIIAPMAAAQARAGNTQQALATARAQPNAQTQATTLLAVAAALAEPNKRGE